MSITSEERELLSQFFGAYFHEDWELDSKEPQGIIELYMKDVTLEKRLIVGQAILKFCDAVSSEGELSEKLFRELGCYYNPSADGFSPKEWLQNVASQLTNA